MSIEVNGVTLPDIPSDVLEQYPYAVITHYELNGAGVYRITLTKEKLSYVPADVMESIEGFAIAILAGLDNDGEAGFVEAVVADGGDAWENLNSNATGYVTVDLDEKQSSGLTMISKLLLP